MSDRRDHEIERSIARLRAMLERERSGQTNESKLRDYLARTLRAQYGFDVSIEVCCSGTPSGKARRIDLYAVPQETWPYREAFPALAIETKLNCDVGTHVTEIMGGKLHDYIGATRWETAGRELPGPPLVLYATPLSVLESQALVWWSGTDALRSHFPQVAEEVFAKIALVVGLRNGYQLFRSVLWECGAAILEGPPDDFSFMSNKVNPGGPRYWLTSKSRLDLLAELQRKDVPK